jgi:hypothetical protein
MMMMMIFSHIMHHTFPKLHAGLEYIPDCRYSSPEVSQFMKSPIKILISYAKQEMWGNKL